MRSLVLACISVAAIGCGSSTTTMPDMHLTSAEDMAQFSACGHPGDKGNSRHIGQYCDNDNPCPTSDLGMLICSDITNPAMPPNQATFFCTTTCSTAAANTPDPSECGENAVCLCRSIGCGCVPAACAPAGMSG